MITILLLILYLFMGLIVTTIEAWLNSAEKIELFDILMVLFYPIIWSIGSNRVYNFLNKNSKA